MKKNVGTADAIMRITCGLTGVAWGTAQMVRHPNRSFPKLLTMASAMKVAEGVTRFCPMLAILKMNSENGLQDEKSTESDAGDDQEKATSPTSYDADEQRDHYRQMQ